MMNEEDLFFTRTVPVDHFDKDGNLVNKELSILQYCMGDTGCVVWDAALVLAMYLQAEHHRCKKGV